MLFRSKKYSSQEETVEFDWETVESGKGRAFTKPTLTVNFDVSNSPVKSYNNRGYVLRVETDVDKLDKIEGLTVLNGEIGLKIREEKNARFRK